MRDRPSAARGRDVAAAAALAAGLITVAIARPAAAQCADAVADDRELSDLSLQDLLCVATVTASRGSELIWDAPASLVVITAEDIVARGYTDLAEVVADLPGFDVSVVNGTQYMLAYQRGYRTPWTQRTLLLIDGKVDNGLWNHAAEITRQYPLSNVARIEVLYGPASTIYGPNAFLGVINIITVDPTEVAEGDTTATVTLHSGSFATRAAELSIQGNRGSYAFELAARAFRSDEPDLSGRWGWLEADQYADRATWGPLLRSGEPGEPGHVPGIENDGVPLGRYYDPTDDHAVMAAISSGPVTIGALAWLKKEGYGPYYAADRVQNNAFWTTRSRQYYLEYARAVTPALTWEALALYRQSDILGQWTEAEPDTRLAMEDFSYVSHTSWASRSDSMLGTTHVRYVLSPMVTLSSGLKLERKELTKGYDIPGYWAGSYSSTVPADDLGPEGLGAGVFHSTSPTYVVPPGPAATMPADNLVITEDVGGFAQGVAKYRAFSFHAGLRYDHNSLYGGVFNPRTAAIYGVTGLGPIDQGAVRLSYGTAFQEPAPVQLWGGWNGRAANPDLQPERARNVELDVLVRTGDVFTEVAFYRADYDDVIAETAENLGERHVLGLEVRSQAAIAVPSPYTERVLAYANYTLTRARSSRYYDFGLAAWLPGERALGDIATHKGNAGVTLVTPWLDLTIKGNVVGRRTVYLRNALRDPTRPDGGRSIAPYAVLDAVLAGHWRGVRVALKVKNLLGQRYFHPGAELANSGDDFAAPRSGGYMNSLVPQAGRSALVTVSIDTP